MSLYNKHKFKQKLIKVKWLAYVWKTRGRQFDSASGHQFNHECHLKLTINECFLDDKNVSSIYLIGDSHATNHFEALNNVFKPIGYDVKLYIDRNIIGYLVLNIEDRDK